MQTSYDNAKSAAYSMGFNPKRRSVLMVRAFMQSIGAKDVFDFMNIFSGTHKESMRKAEQAFWDYFDNA